MPSAMITMEYVGTRWVCEVEASDVHGAHRREHFAVGTIEEAIDACYTSYRSRVPVDPEKPPPLTLPPLEPMVMPDGGLRIVKRGDRDKSQREMREQVEAAEQARADAPDPDAPMRRLEPPVRRKPGRPRRTRAY